MYKLFLKRTIDIILSGIAIILLIPVWILLAVAIKVDDPGPVFFRQKRIGRDKNGQKQANVKIINALIDIIPDLDK